MKKELIAMVLAGVSVAMILGGIVLFMVGEDYAFIALGAGVIGLLSVLLSFTDK